MKNGKFRSIAIDGPSGAGKSALSQYAAEKFGFIHVDTGAIYRTLGLFVSQSGVSPEDTQQIISLLPQFHMELVFDANHNQRMLLSGRDVTDEIRTQHVSEYASHVSKIPEVRTFLLDLQREFATKYDIVMDGRDIGTVVLPHADLKIFLTASIEDRAKRRLEELLQKGQAVTYEEVLESMRWRDHNDSSRDTAPLRPAEDAVHLDTTGNTLEESMALLCHMIQERFAL